MVLRDHLKNYTLVSLLVKKKVEGCSSLYSIISKEFFPLTQRAVGKDPNQVGGGRKGAGFSA